MGVDQTPELLLNDFTHLKQTMKMKTESVETTDIELGGNRADVST